jgi:shikimate kinase
VHKVKRGKVNYFICGFSGAGKSTLLKELEGKTDYDLIDLDDFIFQNLSNKNYSSLGDFIEAEGIDCFRALEFSALMNLSANDSQIVALGGGALNEQTLGILGSWNGLWLNTEFETCWERIYQDQNRPLVKLGKEAMAELYAERMFLYSTQKPVNSAREVIEIIKR